MSNKQKDFASEASAIYFQLAEIENFIDVMILAGDAQSDKIEEASEVYWPWLFRTLKKEVEAVKNAAEALESEIRPAPAGLPSALNG